VCVCVCVSVRERGCEGWGEAGVAGVAATAQRECCSSAAGGVVCVYIYIYMYICIHREREREKG